jgi:hypothetical protein
MWLHPLSNTAASEPLETHTEIPVIAKNSMTKEKPPTKVLLLINIGTVTTVVVYMHLFGQCRVYLICLQTID